VSSVWAGPMWVSPLCGSAPLCGPDPCVGRPPMRGGHLVGRSHVGPSPPVFPLSRVASTRVVSHARAPAPAVRLPVGEHAPCARNEGIYL